MGAQDAIAITKNAVYEKIISTLAVPASSDIFDVYQHLSALHGLPASDPEQLSLDIMVESVRTLHKLSGACSTIEELKTDGGQLEMDTLAQNEARVHALQLAQTQVKFDFEKVAAERRDPALEQACADTITAAKALLDLCATVKLTSLLEVYNVKLSIAAKWHKGGDDCDWTAPLKDNAKFADYQKLGKDTIRNNEEVATLDEKMKSLSSATNPPSKL